MNYFVANGFVSIIAATSIAKLKFANEKNILLIENTKGSTLISQRFVSATNDFYNAQDLLLSSLCNDWDEIYHIECQTTFISFETSLISKLFPSIKGIKIFRNKNNIKSELSKKLKGLNSCDKLIVSDNSCMWRFWYKGQCKLVFIEHGASTYGLSSQSVGWKLIIKKILTFFSDYNYTAKPYSYYLTDGGMKKYEDKIKTPLVFSINVKDSVDEIFSKLYKLLEIKYIEAYNEINYVRRIISKRNMLIYLTNTAIDNSSIVEYFNQQVNQSKVDTNKTFVIIKKHPRDNDDHLVYVKKVFPNYYEFKHPMNKYLPAEFLLYLFDDAKLFGTYSSAHLYSYWWLNKFPLFVNPENDWNNLFQSEYSGTLIDFKQFNNTKQQDLK